MQPAGYVIHQHRIRLNRPTKAYERWVSRMPAIYRESVLNENATRPPIAENDPNCLSFIKHYQSLMPMAMEARKPVFKLLPADGAIGSHMEAVGSCRKDFENLAQRIAQTCGMDLPQ